MTPRPERDDAFDGPLDADLLIEASAGTGKTYALTTLVARLIVEEGLGIDRLLIVTFTISAAGELRTRVRRLLQAARRAAAGAGLDPDSQAGRLRRRWQRCGIDDANALRRLTRAVRDLDGANVTTIHGFCQRTLVEFALHAGTPFSFEVSGGDALAVGDAARDFWRRRMVGEPVPLLEHAKSKRFVLDEDTTTWVARHHAQGQEVRGVRSPEELPRALESRRSQWLKAVRASQDAWSDPAQRAAFQEAADPARWTRTARRRTRVRVRSRMIVDAFDAGAPEQLAPDCAGAFGTRALQAGFYKKNPPPAAPLFDRFDDIAEAGAAYGDLWLASQRLRLLEDAGRSLRHATRVDRSLSFDALLVELHRALAGAGGTELARRIRSRYPVALIDEFQDTDRLQARIFETIYPGGAGAAGGRLFVVGDPKQSIYRFRGADVFAYLEAQKSPGALRTKRWKLERQLPLDARTHPRRQRALLAGTAVRPLRLRVLAGGAGRPGARRTRRPGRGGRRGPVPARPDPEAGRQGPNQASTHRSGRGRGGPRHCPADRAREGRQGGTGRRRPAPGPGRPRHRGARPQGRPGQGGRGSSARTRHRQRRDRRRQHLPVRRGGQPPPPPPRPVPGRIGIQRHATASRSARRRPVRTRHGGAGRAARRRRRLERLAGSRTRVDRRLAGARHRHADAAHPVRRRRRRPLRQPARLPERSAAADELPAPHRSAPRNRDPAAAIPPGPPRLVQAGQGGRPDLRRDGPASPGERREPGEDRHRPPGQGARVPGRLLPVRLGRPRAGEGREPEADGRLLRPREREAGARSRSVRRRLGSRARRRARRRTAAALRGADEGGAPLRGDLVARRRGRTRAAWPGSSTAAARRSTKTTPGP